MKSIFALLAVGVLLAGGCSDHSAETDNGGTVKAAPTTVPPVSATLVPAPPELLDGCQAAADKLGFAVPCPTAVPPNAGPIDCPNACVGVAGPSTDLRRLFVLEIVDFDWPLPAGDVAHIVIDARPLAEAPPQPCIGTPEPGPLATPDVHMVRCASELESQRASQYGEGTHADHTLAYVDRDNIRYAVSAHGHSPASWTLGVDVLRAVRPVAP